jgi:hypothetical protein
LPEGQSGSRLCVEYRRHRASASEQQRATLLAVFVVDMNETVLSILIRELRRQRYSENLPRNCNRRKLRTVDEAMSHVIDWWEDLRPPMKEAIKWFRAQLRAALNSVELLGGHSPDKYAKMTAGNALTDRCMDALCGAGQADPAA